MKRKTPPPGAPSLSSIPPSGSYNVSLLHPSPPTHLLPSPTLPLLLTLSSSGHCSFWARTPTAPLEFIKSYRPHIGSVASATASGTTAASCGTDKSIKIYDFPTFDITGSMKTAFEFGSACAIVSSGEALAVSLKDKGDIVVFDLTTLDTSPVNMISLHARPVTVIKSISKFCVSGDESGMLEYWDAPALGSGIIGGPVQKGTVGFESKMDTDLYKLARKSVGVVDIQVSAAHNFLVVMGTDRRIRVFDLFTGKLNVTYDESLKSYAKQYEAEKLPLDAIDYGALTSRESTVASKSFEPQTVAPRFTMAIDVSERLLLYPTMLGIKVLDLLTHRVVKTIGSPDSPQVRFVGVTILDPNINIDKQVALARDPKAVQKAVDRTEGAQDGAGPMVVAYGCEGRRFYVWDESEVEGPRDIMNEAPDETEADGAGAQGIGADTTTTVILRTSRGDIRMKLFKEECPRTVENFTTHAKNGYYDDVIFHRVIKGFMLQTGDPLGDGTGGESIWGGDFEDEFVRGLRHDRPFTVSMANSGPGTNGSQFFITTAATPWLDNKHTVFGRVEAGKDVCVDIENAQTDHMDKPFEDIKIVAVDVE